MNKLIKPLAMALSIGVIAFILMDKIKPEYKYYYFYSSMNKWSEITEELYEKRKNGYSINLKKKNVYTMPLLFSIATAVASFTFLYKPEKK
jgi:flagellar biosynthesis/type III secretory pathway M-ring protein FliF/YscJ